MKLSHIIAATLTVCILSSPVLAAVVYLKSGEEIDCESYRKQGDRLYVKINGDTEIDFAAEEVDFGKTPAPQKNSGKAATRKARPAVKADPPAEAAESADSMGTHQFHGVPIADDSVVCTPALQNELLARFAKYSRAAEAGDFDEFCKHIIRYQAEAGKKALVGLSKSELRERRKVLQELPVKNYHATACMVSPGTGTAAATGRGKSMSQGRLMNMDITVLFKKEEQSWKVQTTVRNQAM